MSNDLPLISIEDVAAPYAELPAEKYRAMFLRDYDGPDWRFTLRWPSGAETCMNQAATAQDVAAEVARRATQT